MSDSAVTVTVRPDRIAVLVLDQPGSRANVLNSALWQALDAAIAPLATQTDLAGLVIASAKPGIFIAGADLKFLAAVPAPNDPAVRELIEFGLRVLTRLEALPFPTCAALDGATLGGGLEVALACDYRLVGTHERVELGLPEVKLGLIPGWGGTQRLPRLVGVETAIEMLVTGETLTAAEAVAADLVGWQADSPGLIDAAAGELLAATDWADFRAARLEPRDEPVDFDPPETIAAQTAIACVRDGLHRPLADGLRIETTAFLSLAGSDESKRLIGEFFAARKKA